MPSEVEQAMINLIAHFHSYASKGGNPKQLDKKELKSLFETQFPSFVGECKDQAKLQTFLSELDFNKDGQVDFNEFMIMVTALTMIYNEKLEESL